MCLSAVSFQAVPAASSTSLQLYQLWCADTNPNTAVPCVGIHIWLQIGRSEPVGPVHYAQLHGHQSLLLQQVPYQPAFLFAYAHPDLDSELSAKFNSSKVIEPGITQVRLIVGL